MTSIEGRTITGQVNYYSDKKSVEQHPISDLLEKLDAVFAFPEVQAVRWNQYTPYFNDGDACVFEVNLAYVKLVGDDSSGDGEDGFLEAWGTYPDGYWDTHYRWREEAGKLPADDADKIWSVGYRGERGTPLAAAFGAFSNALTGGHHEQDLHKHFGDPAEVLATREGFNVEHYDHD